MKKVKDFFREIRWYEYAFVAFATAILIIFSIIFKINVLYFFSTFFGIIAVSFLSKGNIVGIFISFIQIAFYSTISYINGLYGEVISNACITLPLYIANVIAWAKNLHSKTGEVKIAPTVSVKEIILAIFAATIISVGMYYLLDVFNTNALLFSTLTFALNLLGVYFLIRRNSINFLFYVLSNITGIIMWIIIFNETKDYSIIATFINLSVFLILNIYGIFNWKKLKNNQKKSSTNWWLFNFLEQPLNIKD